MITNKLTETQKKLGRFRRDNKKQIRATLRVASKYNFLIKYFIISIYPFFYCEYRILKTKFIRNINIKFRGTFIFRQY